MAYGDFHACPECPRGWWRAALAFAFNLGKPLYYPSFQAGLCGYRIRSDHWSNDEAVQILTCLYPIFLSQLVRQNSAGSYFWHQGAATASDGVDRFGLVYHPLDPLQPLHVHWVSQSSPGHAFEVDHVTGFAEPLPGGPSDFLVLPDNAYAWLSGAGNAEYLYLRARLAAQTAGTAGCDDPYHRCRPFV